MVEALDNLNETTLNIFKNTYVRDVTFSADTTAGGAGTTVTLTLTVTGNANSFDINWGDGTTDSNVTDTTPSHTYTSNAGSPIQYKLLQEILEVQAQVLVHLLHVQTS